MKSKVLLTAGVITLAGFLVTACAPDISAGTYTAGETGQAAATAPGVIIAATPVRVTSNSGLGTAIGAVAGGVAGSTIGGGTTSNILGAVGGAVVGGVAGHYAEGALSTQTGMQYTVRLRNRHLYTITQGMNPVLSVGQRVMVIFSDPARVVARY